MKEHKLAHLPNTQFWHTNKPAETTPNVSNTLLAKDQGRSCQHVPSEGKIYTHETSPAQTYQEMTNRKQWHEAHKLQVVEA